MSLDKSRHRCISRRSFLHGMGTGVTAAVMLPELAAGAFETRYSDEESVKILLNRPALPVLRTAEVVIAGGSFGAVAAALEFARAGRQVVLVEPRTYLGREITATLRPWVDLGKLACQNNEPELIRTCLESTGTGKLSGELPLRLDAVKLALENLLLEAGVELVYASQLIGVLEEGERIGGVIIGNKSGRQIITGHLVLDATETAAVARAAGAEFEAGNPDTSIFKRTLEFVDVLPLPEISLSVPDRMGALGNKVTLHRGYLGDKHVLVEFSMALGSGGIDFKTWIQREIEARRRSMELASYLIKHERNFVIASLSAASYELDGYHTTSMVVPPPDWAADYNSEPLTVTGKNLEEIHLSTASFAGPVRHLWCVQEAARLERSQMQLIHDPVTASLLGAALASNLAAQWNRIQSCRSPVKPVYFSDRTNRFTMDLEVKEPESPQHGRWYQLQSIPPQEVPVVRTVDVLVVGGGTSGATAAITTAREGLSTVLLEMNPGLGGTATLGGITSYWFGRRVGFNARVRRLVEEVHERLNHRGDVWNIEAKMHALLHEVEIAGVEIFLNATTIGAVVQGNRVRGALVANRFGVFAVLAKVVIDATGDGDVAAFAGAEYTYGSRQHHLVMWYSLAQFAEPGRTRRNFTSMVDVSNIEDYTRAILVGRRRGGNCHDHGIYIASRETRHIRGDTTLTLTGQLRQKRWHDVVNIHFSNYDIKGKSESDWVRMGLIPPNLEVEIPYRVLLPRGLENILVAGKAISATHDAFPSVRMQADMENLGGVVALAAAEAVKEGIVPRRISVKKLQKRLVEMGILPDSVLGRRIERKTYNDTQLRALVTSLDPEKPLHAYSDMDMDEVFRGRIPIIEICTAGPHVLPILEQALRQNQAGRRVRIAQALAMYDSQAGVPALIEEIERHLAGGTLPERTSRIRHAGFPPDQGAMPDVVYLIHSLGMIRDRRTLAVWECVAELLSPSEENLRDRFQGTFYYIDAVCRGAELMGDPAAVSILEKIHAHPTLSNQVLREGFQPDFFRERQAMLELNIGRALARCGSPRGAEILISYLDDVRSLLAEQAHAVLVSITGRDYGKDARAWSAWLDQAWNSLKPSPLPLGPET